MSRLFFTLTLLLLSAAAPAASSAPANDSPAKSFSGIWETSFGRMQLHQAGQAVNGSYSYTASSEVAGVVEGDKLTFSYREGDTEGEGWFELSDDGESFSGKWREDKSTKWRAWTGTRVHPEEGVVWLVILEAHWEESLAEEEYAFGDMLRSYFTMSSARHVRVRYRTFHDEKDLRQWSRELRYFAEPVVLLISTHGSPEGVQVSGDQIGAEAIAECVRGANTLEALHLSGCSMMAGDVPAKIQNMLGPEQKLPITGYTTSVAWDASALADFVYLSMVLIHRMSPVEAVAQTHILAPFTREERVEGARYQALGLRSLSADGVMSSSKRTKGRRRSSR